jgi:hypothetical protein
MSDVVDFPGITKLRTPINTILATAAGAKLQDIVIVGWREDGDMYFASSDPDGAQVLWLLRQAEHELIASVRE